MIHIWMAVKRGTSYWMPIAMQTSVAYHYRLVHQYVFVGNVLSRWNIHTSAPPVLLSQNNDWGETKRPNVCVSLNNSHAKVQQYYVLVDTANTIQTRVLIYLFIIPTCLCNMYCSGYMSLSDGVNLWFESLCAVDLSTNLEQFLSATLKLRSRWLTILWFFRKHLLNTLKKMILRCRQSSSNSAMYIVQVNTEIDTP